jgi:hypothetical protein
VLRRERVIGIVSSWDIRRRDSEGYSLLITDSRLVGAALPVYADDFWAFFPPGNQQDSQQAQEAEKRARQIVLKRDLELQRDKIVKIIYESPGMLVGGRLLFVTVGRKVQVNITVISGWNPGIYSTLNTLISALLVFAPEGFYDGKTGSKVRHEFTLQR